MPFKDPQRRREYARSYYSSLDQRAKKRVYDHARYMENREEVRAKNDRALYPHRFVYDGGWMCAECGSLDKLVIHHKDFNHANNDPSNLVCLCASCHSSLHAKASVRDSHGRFSERGDKLNENVTTAEQAHGASQKPMMRLFVSQPMNGRTDEEIFEERWEALDLVQSAHPDRYVVLVESFLSETPEGVHPPLWYLGASLQLMAGADMVFMAPGWASALGCQLEHLAARKYGLDVAYYDQFLGAPQNISEDTDSEGE